VWKGLFLAIWGVPTSLPCSEEGLGVETSREGYTASGACSPWSLGSRWCDCCGCCAVGMSWWAAGVGCDVLGPFQYACRLESVC